MYIYCQKLECISFNPTMSFLYLQQIEPNPTMSSIYLHQIERVLGHV